MEIFPYEHTEASQPAQRDENVSTAHVWIWILILKMADADNSGAASSTSSTSRSKKEAKKYFRWDLNMVQNLIECLLEYKSKMEYKSLDFYYIG